MRGIGVFLVVVVSAALSGCVTASASVRGEHDETFSSAGVAFTSAREAFAVYLATLDEVSAAGGDGVERLKPLVTSEQFVLEQAHADLLRLGGYTTRGATTFDGSTLRDEFDYGLGVASITMRVCLDTTDVRTHDSFGYDITAGTGRHTYEVTFVTASTPPFELRLEEAQPCEPATC